MTTLKWIKWWTEKWFFNHLLLSFFFTIESGWEQMFHGNLPLANQHTPHSIRFRYIYTYDFKSLTCNLYRKKKWKIFKNSLAYGKTAYYILLVVLWIDYTSASTLELIGSFSFFSFSSIPFGLSDIGDGFFLFLHYGLSAHFGRCCVPASWLATPHIIIFRLFLDRPHCIHFR